ncbi:hypothetical protein ABIE56_000335 [Luteibacter sp. 621]
MLCALPSGNLGEGVWAAMILVPVSYASMVFPGSVLYWVVRRLHWVFPWVYALLGVLCAGAACIAVWWGTWGERFAGSDSSMPATVVTFAMIAVIFGAPTGFVFWKLEQPKVNDRGAGSLDDAR